MMRFALWPFGLGVGLRITRGRDVSGVRIFGRGGDIGILGDEC
jgi:hypothetical protein